MQEGTGRGLRGGAGLLEPCVSYRVTQTTKVLTVGPFLRLPRRAVPCRQVSVASGGIVPKMSLGFAMESARQAAVTMGSYDGAVSWNERLCVDCPLTGAYGSGLAEGLCSQTQSVCVSCLVTATQTNRPSSLHHLHNTCKSLLLVLFYAPPPIRPAPAHGFLPAGRDVSNGTFRIDLVRGAFVQAARKLEALARGRRISDTSLNYLQVRACVFCFRLRVRVCSCPMTLPRQGSWPEA
mgnify:CR=1 FL=1